MPRLLPALLILALLSAGCGDGAAEPADATLVERWFTYPVSHIAISREGKKPGEEG